VTSVLICDDRPAVRRGLSDMLRPLRPVVESRCVSDGFALLDAYAAQPAEPVLIGIHPAAGAGAEAADLLLLGMYPTSAVIIVGSIADVGLLAAAYARGAQGLLFWDPDQNHP
jgi:DNA-binding NarL/FixJ family response regulator